MNVRDTTPDILEQIERDCAPDVAKAFLALATDYMADTRDRARRVSTLSTPAALAARFDEPMPREGRPVDAILRQLRDDVIPDSNHLFHPRYVGHQVSAALPIPVWMEAVTAALNQSAAVFEMSPVGTVIEHLVVRWLCQAAGYSDGAAGTLTTGGSEATFTALLAARNIVLPDSWTQGVGDDPPVLLCGEHTHYAVTRAAGELGIGMKNAIAVRSSGFKMDPRALREALEQLARSGRPVLAVVATAGSTATGSFDDLEPIANACDEHGVWLHVDGAHGASALLSARHRHRVRGIERARSIAWDPHKMMLLPLQAGMLLMRSEGDLGGAFSQRAPYLFQGGEAAKVWDQGPRSFLCSRRVDAFKLWVTLQRYGANGLGALYDHLCGLTHDFWEIVADVKGFVPSHEPECNILCFRYVGDGSVDDARLDDVNRELRERYNRSGEGWITATNLDGRRVLRVTIMNPRTTLDDLRFVLDGLAKQAKAIAS